MGKSFYTEGEDLTTIVKDAQTSADKQLKDIDKETDSAMKNTKSISEDGEDRLKNFIAAIKQAEDARASETRIKNDPVCKLRMIQGQETPCKDACMKHMLGSLYIGALPVEDTYKDQHNAELRDDLSKFVDKKGTALRYVTDAYERCGKQNIALKKMIEACECEFNNFNSLMGIDISTKTTDDIKFQLDDDVKDRLDRVTRDINYKEITDAIRSNVTDAAVSEINRAKAEAAAQQELEEELAKSTEEPAENAQVSQESVRPANYIPSLFEAVLVNKTKLAKESGTDASFDDVYTEAIKEYTKLSLAQALMLERYSKFDSIALANQYMYG